MPELLSTPPVRNSDFTWDPQTRRYTAEESDLPRGLLTSRAFLDSADQGITFLGKFGSRVPPLVLSHVETDQEGDTLWWDFTPILPEHATAGGGFAGVRVFND